jgi:hypothetical protein
LSGNEGWIEEGLNRIIWNAFLYPNAIAKFASTAFHNPWVVNYLNTGPLELPE